MIPVKKRILFILYEYILPFKKIIIMIPLLKKLHVITINGQNPEENKSSFSIFPSKNKITN